MPNVALTNSQIGAYGGQLFDHLPLPNGGTIGNTHMDEVRRILHRMQIPEAHTLNKEALCRRYNELLHKVGNEARTARLNYGLSNLRTRPVREYSSNKYDGKWRRCDVETVVLDGRRLYDLDQWEIFRQLTRLNVPRITQCGSKDEMIFLYWLHQQETIERAGASNG
jgi:hypothetical protein